MEPQSAMGHYNLMTQSPVMDRHVSSIETGYLMTTRDIKHGEEMRIVKV